MRKLFIDYKNLLDPPQSWCPRFRFGPQKHKPGHQFIGRGPIIQIVRFDASEDTVLLPGTLGRNMCDQYVRHGMADFEHLVPQVHYLFMGMLKKSKYLPLRNTTG